MFFRDVIGQEDVKQRLIHSVKTGQIAHAQLFCGPEGVGKFPLALAMPVIFNVLIKEKMMLVANVLHVNNIII